MRSKPMSGHCPKAILAVVVIAAVGTAPAQPPWVTQHRRGDAVVATVKKVSEHEGTNKNPPTVELEVHEVLRGDAELNRTSAVWKPAPMGILCPVGLDMKKLTKDWEDKKLAGPKVGDKLILWGEMSGDKKKPVFEAFTWEIYPFSDEKKTWAVKTIKAIEEEIRRADERRAAEQKAKAKALADWRAKVTTDDLTKYAAEADVVLVGRIASTAESTDQLWHAFNAYVLKGENLPKPLGAEFNERFYRGLATVTGLSCIPVRDTIHVEVHLPRAVGSLLPDWLVPAAVKRLLPRVSWYDHLDRDTDYLLFLTLEGATPQPVSVVYKPTKSGDGVVIADQKALATVKEALGKK